MDCLSKRKFVIVCHEKVVRIPMEGDEILRVYGERTLGAAKALMNAKSKEEHEVHLKLVLESRRKEKLYAKFSKCEFWLEEVHFLGYYRRSSRIFFRLLNSLTSLTERNQKYEWSVEQEEAFQTLKNDLCDTLAFKQENVLAERLHGLDQQMERKGDESLYGYSKNHKKTVKAGQTWTRERKESTRAGRMSPVLWAEIGESSLTGLELVQETTDKVVLVKENPKTVSDHQKSYADYRRKPLEFEVGDCVLLKVTPWKGVVRFGKKGKLAPRYVVPFEILERIGLVAYRLRLPKELNSVHDTFHVSN
ncbi:hypothetical protein Tco_0938616 [Tanacetum coccineum]|uniref:Tf2-1-like SH3-like domain-containing protein n=1 Tax=Tanacetum coccineum TaxID=301880 RepID=A0ABQ5DHP7_9ASTR